MNIIIIISTQIRSHISPGFLLGWYNSKELFAELLLNKERVIEGLIANLLCLEPVMMLFGETIEKSGTPESLLSCLENDLSARNWYGFPSKGVIKLWALCIGVLSFLVINWLMLRSLSFWSYGNLLFWKPETPPVSPLCASILMKTSAVIWPGWLEN